MNLNQVTVEVADITRATAFYQRLGLELIVSADHYARLLCPGGATFSVHLADAVQPGGTLVYFECEDLDARVSALKAVDVVFDSGPADQRWLWREARLRDPDGNRLCLYFAGENRVNPPWRLKS
ncbi:VOC family protein [Brevundimonas sp.]|uniref:VOC family protein n=1 Tax=Brevundimonas sp. TaxID=1871086 RepID=UPI001D6D1B6F|nr:VOC family protein [Brevundimonas sp.]MBA4001606.1 glyoxalase/bleomycin resistance/extradiol dioxygenase family protein [Brevundimonas sp.]